MTDPATSPTPDTEDAQRAEPGAPDAKAATLAPPERRDRLELVAAIVLALATILTAWSAYQATRWSGEQANAYSQAAARRTDAAQETSLYAAEALLDTQLFLSWLELQRTDDGVEVAAFLQERFRDEFTPAFEAWLAQVPAGDIPPGTPFDMEQYESATGELVLALVDEADTLVEEAQRANQLADDFVLVTVIMATVLFFAGIVTQFRDRRLRLALLGLAVILLASGITFTLTMPQRIAI